MEGRRQSNSWQMRGLGDQLNSAGEWNKCDQSHWMYGHPLPIKSRRRRWRGDLVTSRGFHVLSHLLLWPTAKWASVMAKVQTWPGGWWWEALSVRPSFSHVGTVWQTQFTLFTVINVFHCLYSLLESLLEEYFSMPRNHSYKHGVYTQEEPCFSDEPCKEILIPG